MVTLPIPFNIGFHDPVPSYCSKHIKSVLNLAVPHVGEGSLCEVFPIGNVIAVVPVNTGLGAKVVTTEVFNGPEATISPVKFRFNPEIAVAIWGSSVVIVYEINDALIAAAVSGKITDRL